MLENTLVRELDKNFFYQEIQELLLPSKYSDDATNDHFILGSSQYIPGALYTELIFSSQLQ